eukprot:g2106.t1
MRRFAMIAIALLALLRAVEADYPFVGKWRGRHGHAEGLCTADLVAPKWIATAGHCAVRMLKHEKVSVQVTFQGVVRGLIRCVHAPEKVDVALCELKLPVNHIAPVALNAETYTTKHHAKFPVFCVGTYHGTHVTGPKTLEYEVTGAHLYVDNSGGSGMHAGDSGGGWFIKQSQGNASNYLLTGIIHGGTGSGSHKKGVAAQPPFLRAWIDRETNRTVKWLTHAEAYDA